MALSVQLSNRPTITSCQSNRVCDVVEQEYHGNCIVNKYAVTT